MNLGVAELLFRSDQTFGCSDVASFEADFAKRKLQMVAVRALDEMKAPTISCGGRDHSVTHALRPSLETRMHHDTQAHAVVGTHAHAIPTILIRIHLPFQPVLQFDNTVHCRLFFGFMKLIVVLQVLLLFKRPGNRGNTPLVCAWCLPFSASFGF